VKIHKISVFLKLLHSCWLHGFSLFLVHGSLNEGLRINQQHLDKTSKKLKIVTGQYLAKKKPGSRSASALP